jgi:cysteine desulfurase/selenocysteine lyase
MNRSDFPQFHSTPNLVYLDSTATSLKPQVVLDAEQEYYSKFGVNIHRGVYALSIQATESYEAVREQVRNFINAKSTKEIIFTKGTTEGINLVAYSYGQQLHKGDVILLSEMEHHANIVPWQALVASRGVELRWIPVTEDGDLDLTNIDELLQGVKLVAVTQMSNVLGIVNDINYLSAKAHDVGAKIFVDGAQSVPHMPVDVQALDCDFLVFSAHKMCGPTGVGVLYIKEEILQTMEPYQRGGDMILEVTKETATWNEIPYKFEAGTPNIAGVIGFGAAIKYLQEVGMEHIWNHEQELSKYGIEQLSKIPGLKILGAEAQSPRGAIFAFDIPGIHPHDIGSILDEQGICIRAGHHCAMPLHKNFGLVATTRASGYFYTTKEDIDALVVGLKKVQEMFR